MANVYRSAEEVASVLLCDTRIVSQLIMDNQLNCRMTKNGLEVLLDDKLDRVMKIRKTSITFEQFYKGGSIKVAQKGSEKGISNLSKSKPATQRIPKKTAGSEYFGIPLQEQMRRFSRGGRAQE